MPAKTEYLWSTLTAINRSLDNVRIAGQAIEAVEQEIRELQELNDLPEGCELGPLLEGLKRAQAEIQGAIAEGEPKAGMFKQALLSQEGE